MKDKDIKVFLEDFRKADKAKKLDMWFYALDQEGLWEELLAEMSMIAQMQNTSKKMAGKA